MIMITSFDPFVTIFRLFLITQSKGRFRFLILGVPLTGNYHVTKSLPSKMAVVYYRDEIDSSRSFISSIDGFPIRYGFWID